MLMAMLICSPLLTASELWALPVCMLAGRGKRLVKATSATFLLCMRDWLWLSFATYSESTTSRLLILCVCLDLHFLHKACCR